MVPGCKIQIQTKLDEGLLFLDRGKENFITQREGAYDPNVDGDPAFSFWDSDFIKFPEA